MNDGWSLVGAFVVGGLIAGGVAAADDTPTFASPGVVEIGVGTNLDASYNTVRPPTGPSYSNKFFGVTSNAAYFVSDGLSIGGSVSFGYESFGSQTPWSAPTSPRSGSVQPSATTCGFVAIGGWL